MIDDLADLPKAHLHLHLEGAMRPATLRDLCGRNGIEMPGISAYGSFEEFLATYMAACEVLRTPDDLRRLIDEVVEDAAADGCPWIEPAFYPAHHAERLGPERRVWEMAIEFGADSAARHGVGVGWLAGIDRTKGIEDADRVTDLVLDLVSEGAPIVALGLHNDEVGFPPGPFASHFARAGEAGLIRAPHAGELVGPASVSAALDLLGADRIQHGVRAIEDPDLVDRLARSGVVLDVCPTSNLMLSVVESLESHPLPALLDAGVRCSVNADDPLLFGSSIGDEYRLCTTTLGLSDQQIASVARHSFGGSAAPDRVVGRALQGIDRWLDQRTSDRVG